MDMTYYVLIVRLRNNVRLKILETKNATKIRKEVSKSLQIFNTFFLFDTIILIFSSFAFENSWELKTKSLRFTMRHDRKMEASRRIDTVASPSPTR